MLYFVHVENSNNTLQTFNIIYYAMNSLLLPAPTDLVTLSEIKCENSQDCIITLAIKQP